MLLKNKYRRYKMNLGECNLDHAVLHEPTFIPGANGKGVNLKNTLSVNSVEGRAMGLKMTLMNNFIFVETTAGSGLLPVSNFKLCVPMKMKQAEATASNEKAV